MSASRDLVVLLLAGFLLILAGCGDSSASRVQPLIPVFTSTPVTAASQGALYTYQLAAMDPAGGTVSFSLSAGPSGATLNGNALNWTPAASQSRISNGFTVVATTSSGGSANQSWMVSPNGTITVNRVVTYWTPAGPLQIGISPLPIEVSAVVPMADGSLAVFPGSTTTPGVVTIPGVPAGYYWLAYSSLVNPLLANVAYWTSTSTFDDGIDIAGSPVPLATGNSTTTFNFSLSGLDSVAAPTSVEFSPGIQFFPDYLTDPAASSTLSASFGMNSNVDWSQVNTAFLLQYEPSRLRVVS